MKDADPPHLRASMYQPEAHLGPVFPGKTGLVAPSGETRDAVVFCADFCFLFICPIYFY